MEGNYTITVQDGQEFEEIYNRSQQGLDTIRLATDIIAPFGIILNFIFLFVAVRVKSMRTIVNVYLSNLAVADSLYLIRALIASLSPPTEYGNDILIRIISILVLETARCASFCFVTAIAVERFSAVHHPISFRSSATKTRAAKISAGLWVLSVVLGVTKALLMNPQFASDDAKTCNTIFLIDNILSLIIYVSTFAITVSTYVYMLIKLGHSTPASQQHPRQFGKVVCMLLINTAVFFLCNSMIITYHIIFLKQYIHPDQMYFQFKVTTAAVILNVINSSINPLVYSATNSTYRAAVVEAFSFLNLARCCKKRKTQKRQGALVERRELRTNGPRAAAKVPEQEQRELSAIGPRDAAEEVVELHIHVEPSAIGPRDAVQAPAQEQIEPPAIGPRDAAQELGQVQIELSAIGPRDAARELGQMQIELSAIGLKDASQEPVQEQIELSAIGPRDAAQEPVQEQIELSSIGPRDAAQEPVQEQIELSAIGPRDAAQEPVQEQREMSSIRSREQTSTV